MIYADDIRRAILKIAEEKGFDKTFDPAEVARKMDKDNWMGIMDQVKFVADVLIEEGKIDSQITEGLMRYKKIHGN